MYKLLRLRTADTNMTLYIKTVFQEIDGQGRRELIPRHWPSKPRDGWVCLTQKSSFEGV